MKTFLETSVVVDLHFRSQKQAANCRAHLPAGAALVVTAYVLFELARGHVDRLCRLHDLSRSCTHEDELRVKITEGQAPYKRDMDTWNATLNDDAMFVRKMKAADGKKWRLRAPQYFRARLRNVVIDGWDECAAAYPLSNAPSCRENLPSPYRDTEGLLQHNLPTDDCGKPGNCGALAFARANRAHFETLRGCVGKSKAKHKKGERERQVGGIDHLLAAAGEDFVGTHCHGCGDTMICMEAREGTVVTKDGDFTRLTKALGAKMVKVPNV